MNKPMKPPKLLKLIKVGNSTGVILSKEMLAHLGARAGDTLDVIESPAGFELQLHDGGFAEQMQAAREVMARRRNALRELAK